MHLTFNTDFYMQYIQFKKYIFLLLIFAGVFPVSVNAQKDSVRLWGRTCDKDEQAMYGVRISCQIHKDSVEKTIAVTDMDGKYQIVVPKRSLIRFSMESFNEHIITHSQNTKTREYNVIMAMGEELKNITVVAKYIPPKIDKRKTRIRGNYMYIYQPVYIHRDSSKSDNRYIAQCFITNRSTNQVYFTKPATLDGKEYHLTQTRMYGYELEKDPLSRNLSIKGEKIKANRDSIQASVKMKKQQYKIKSKELQDKGFSGELEYDETEYDARHSIRSIEKRINMDTIYVVDTIKVNKNTDFCRTDLYYGRENYRKIMRVDTLFISEGIQYPERFLDYRIGSSLYSNENNYPKLDLTPRESEPEKIPIRFHIGKATVDMNDSITSRTLQQIALTLENINNSTEAQLLSFSIHATASPDGNYERNKSLAYDRLTNAVKEINALSSGALQGIKQNKVSEVATWKDVANLMRQDSLNAEAEQVEACLGQRNPEGSISHLSFYPLIKDKYLPMLRSVEYQYTYTFYRELSVNEIQAEYARNKSSLVLPHYFKLYRHHIAEKNDSLAEVICSEAYQRFPKDNYVRVVACDLVALRNNLGKPDTTTLAPYIDRKYEREQEIFVNQTLALLKAEDFERASALSDRWVKSTADNLYMKSVITFLGGYELEPKMEAALCNSTRNRIVYLLANDADDAAYKLAKDSLQYDRIKIAENAYIAAICYARKKERDNAKKYLLKALDMKPSLTAIAKIDADVIEIMRDIEKKDENEPNQPANKEESEVPNA